MNEWSIAFDNAAEALTTALYSGAIPSGVERLAAAKVFRETMDRFKSGGNPAKAIVQVELQNSDFYRFCAAIKLFIEIGDAASLAELSQNPATYGHRVPERDLKRLWKSFPPSIDSYDDAFVNLISSDDPIVTAFYLGLNGDSSGVEFLKNSADNPDSQQAVEACYYLAQLALPDAIEPMIHILASDDADAIALAINIAANLGLPAFIPALRHVTERKIVSPTYSSETPTYDEAIRAIRDIVGKPLDDLGEEYVDYSTERNEEFYGEGEFTEAFRNQALAISREAFQSMDSMKRYYRGELLTLTHLASDLLSPHAGPSYRAAYNLRAITGEDYGFDPDDDLITNLPAIEAWQKRANRPEPLEPGGWAFWGKSLPTPEIDLNSE